MKTSIRQILLLGSLLTGFAMTGNSYGSLFPSSLRGTYTGTLRLVDTKYGVNATISSAYRVSASATRFSTGRDTIFFRSDGTAKNRNWVSARYTTRGRSVIISGQFRDSSDASAGAAGNFRYIIRFKSGGVVTVASTSAYNSGGYQTIQFAGRK